MKSTRIILVFLAGALILSACVPPAPRPASGTHTLTILYTNDEHGWLLPALVGQKMTSGAAEIMGLWEKSEGYAPGGSIVALSGGDMWTGPAISTWFKGESAAEAMNAMGYRAAALGNHDFDFGREVLKQRRAASQFPFLAGNVTTPDGKPFDLADPYIIVQTPGAQLGIVGLAYRDTPQVTKQDNVAGLVFGDYEAALRKWVPEARSKGVQLVIVLAHVCLSELDPLARQVADLNLPLMLGAHCHELGTRQAGKTWLVESGAFMRAYSRVDMDVSANGQVSAVRVKQPRNEWDKGGKPAAPPDSAIQAVVNKWEAQANQQLAQVIGYTAKGIDRPWPMYNLVTDAWLWSYPQADIALTNVGGFRQNVPPGDITLGTIVGVLPFENTIYDVKITGAQLLTDLFCCGGVAASGIKVVNGKTILTKTGQPVDPQATYRVLINDFMYTGGDRFPFQTQDPHGYDTAINWRQPVIDYILSLHTTASAPLDTHLDRESRGTSNR